MAEYADCNQEEANQEGKQAADVRKYTFVILSDEYRRIKKL